MEIVILTAAGALAFWVISATRQWLVDGVPPHMARPLLRRLERRRVRRAGPRPAEFVLLELELELSRIAQCLQYEYLSPQPRKAERVRAWVIAYDQVLLEICEHSAVDAPRVALPLSAQERFRLEHVLVGVGRSW